MSLKVRVCLKNEIWQRLCEEAMDHRVSLSLRKLSLGGLTALEKREESIVRVSTEHLSFVEGMEEVQESVSNGRWDGFVD
jgi:hypothetical protein